MPMPRRRLALEASPASVADAREWVTRVFDELGRADLLDSVRLGVSELVTNALLHAEPPVSVEVSGTAAHPVVEVHDGSTVVPRTPHLGATSPAPSTAPSPESVTTVGRGLGLVAMTSHRWGVDVRADSGKAVWFEPGADSESHTVEELLDLFDDEQETTTATAAAAVAGARDELPEGYLRIRLLGLPAGLMAQLRSYLAELRRELGLLALTAPEDHPKAVEFGRLSERVEANLRLTRGVEVFEQAAAQGRARVDVDLVVPPSGPEALAAFSDSLNTVYHAAADDELLVVAPSYTLVKVQEWYVEEFVRQAAGGRPRPWLGPA